MTATTTAQPSPPPVAAARPRSEALRLADGVELIGHFEGSGFKTPPFLVRRPDGEVVQLTKLLYAIASLSDGCRDAHVIAQILTHASNREFAAADVHTLVERRLRPIGVLARADGTSAQGPKREVLMALRHRRPLLSSAAVNALARPFTWLHRPLVTAMAALALLTFDVWLFAIHGLAAGMRTALYNPELLLAVLGSVVVGTAFHEIGHASACRYSGARPGVMGVGFYLVYPAFYCDVTDAYRLNRMGRLRTDLGGVYFNGLFALLAGGVFFATGQEAALLAAAIQHVILLQQLIPLMRFDGYYVLTDLTGVPDILSRIKPIFRSLVRGREREPQVAELKPWVRLVVTAYLVALAPTMLFLFLSMVAAVPRVVATAHDSFGQKLDQVMSAQGAVETAVGVVGILALVLPLGAMALSLTRVGRLLARGLARWGRRGAPHAVAACMTAVALTGALAYAWWPDGGYTPIRPGERGTLADAVPTGDFSELLGAGRALPERANRAPVGSIYGHVPTDGERASVTRRTRPGRAGRDASPSPTRGAVTKAPADAPTAERKKTSTTTAPQPSTSDPTATSSPDPATADGTSTTPGPDPSSTGATSTSSPDPATTDATTPTQTSP